MKKDPFLFFTWGWGSLNPVHHPSDRRLKRISVSEIQFTINKFFIVVHIDL